MYTTMRTHILYDTKLIYCNVPNLGNIKYVESMRNAKEQKASEGAKEGDTESDAALKEAAHHDKRISSVRFLYIDTALLN